jgi:hypothetical protein
MVSPLDAKAKELVKRLQLRAKVKGDSDINAGRKPPEYGKESEFEWKAADFIATQAERIAELERERDEALPIIEEAAALQCELGSHYQLQAKASVFLATLRVKEPQNDH